MNYQSYLSQEHPRVTMTIKDFGTIEIELFPEVAPNTVNNFIHLVSKGFYNGLLFHRVIPGFMIQGGWGSEELRPIKGEFSSNGFENNLRHTRGIISMARTSDPNSQTSQFFIMHQNAPHLDGQYAAFGGVLSGLEVVDAIANVKRDQRDRPYEDVTIESVTVDLKDTSYPSPVTL
ncbi:MAG: peptidylprolyl isomerase [Acholeplasmataceae bacterium]|jgi:peptidyl-prolyl cis-trans isomerase B (cyclophilin B)|nr:peptidylprolyl isomerase [Acholeplasmataceae bacterium]